MTDQEALKYMQKKSQVWAEAFRRLKGWDTKKTVLENAVALKIRPTVANSFSQVYGLKFKWVGPGGNSSKTRKYFGRIDRG